MKQLLAAMSGARRSNCSSNWCGWRSSNWCSKGQPSNPNQAKRREEAYQERVLPPLFRSPSAAFSQLARNAKTLSPWPMRSCVASWINRQETENHVGGGGSKSCSAVTSGAAGRRRLGGRRGRQFATAERLSWFGETGWGATSRLRDVGPGCSGLDASAGVLTVFRVAVQLAVQLGKVQARGMNTEWLFLLHFGWSGVTRLHRSAEPVRCGFSGCRSLAPNYPGPRVQPRWRGGAPTVQRGCSDGAQDGER